MLCADPWCSDSSAGSFVDFFAGWDGVGVACIAGRWVRNVFWCFSVAYLFVGFFLVSPGVSLLAPVCRWSYWEVPFVLSVDFLGPGAVV